MHATRWHWFAMAIVAAGVLVSWLSMLASSHRLSPGAVGVLMGGLLSLAGLLWFRRTLSGPELDAAQLAEERREFEGVRAALARELNDQAASLDRRRQELTRRLALWHEWMEFPEPIDLAAPSSAAALAAEDAATAKSSENDRKLVELLDAESKRLFENVLQNKYSVGGQFQPAAMRDDAYVLIRKVARIYRPDLENPLLETSIDKLARAASRACLHFLVVLEQLPVKVQHYNVGSMYAWVKQGVKAYGVYQSARPYLPYVNSAYYLSRVAMGTNPFSLLAWWAASEVASRSASAVTTRILHQKSLALLHDVVRVIGYEVASLYGGDVRHRDANWIYGVELTELVSRFPLSRDSLSSALKEVGSIQLLNEYDRIFLYRCLAAHRSAQPQRYAGTLSLTSVQRQAVATRLEKFFAAYIHGKNPKVVSRWRSEAQDRLGVKLQLETHEPAGTPQERIEDAISSLASFLVSVKQVEPHELAAPLGQTRLFGELEQARREPLLARLAESPPYFFEQPDLDPDDGLAEAYLNDLARVAVRAPPRDMPVEPLLMDAGGYLRRDERQMNAIIQKQLASAFADQCAPSAAAAKLSQPTIRAAMWFLEPGERVLFAYEGVECRLAGQENAPHPERAGQYALLGTDRKLLALRPGELPQLAWLAAGPWECRPDEGRWIAGCRISGGAWLDGLGPGELHIRGAAMRRFESYFAPLLAYGRTTATA